MSLEKLMYYREFKEILDTSLKSPIAPKIFKTDARYDERSAQMHYFKTEMELFGNVNKRDIINKFSEYVTDQFYDKVFVEEKRDEMGAPYLASHIELLVMERGNLEQFLLQVIKNINPFLLAEIQNR